ncbi:MAG: serine/threonine protein kinase, partial [Myxococcales bacterium]|nr:serine/threonine protein kinase [Myxococcales bacterium]
MTATAPVDGGADGAPLPPTLGHFTLGRVLGAGGMGIVFAAHDTRLDRRVALKLVRPGGSSAEARERLAREGKALARLSHANVVTVYEIGAAGDQLFIVMELVDGTTLRDWIGGERRPWREIVRVFVAAGRGLQAAHSLGLIHRDFKPSNVLLDRSGAVKVSDFGLVGTGDELAGDALRAAGTAPASVVELTRTGAVMGTPAYMAPEQQHGERLDARADQYSFCLSLYEALTGSLPPERRMLAESASAASARPVPRSLRA